MRSFNRRKFNGLCVALGAFATASGASALDAASGVASTRRTVKFRDGTVVSALGQGSAGLGKGKRPQGDEEDAVRTGISLGMTLIDTAEVYGSEEFIGRAIAGQRDRVFLVSKVWPNHVSGNGIARACQASLTRLGTNHLDLYLLHWPNGVTNISSVVTAFEKLRDAGKIAPGASPILRSATWKICSVFQRAIAARLINSLTISATVLLNMTCCHGAAGTACR